MKDSQRLPESTVDEGESLDGASLQLEFGSTTDGSTSGDDEVAIVPHGGSLHYPALTLLAQGPPERKFRGVIARLGKFQRVLYDLGLSASLLSG